MSIQQAQFTRLPFGVVSAHELLHVFHTVDDNLIIGYDTDGWCHGRILQEAMQICHHENLKLNKNKCHLRSSKMLLSGEEISREGMPPGPKKLHVLIEMPLLNNKNA